MREDICTIPISEIFEPKDGCPLCRMRDLLEDRMSTYITGAAMMEPDVRIETNAKGFCEKHFNMVLSRGARLSVALIQESLLATVEEEIFPKEQKAPFKKVLSSLQKRSQSCFMCENVELYMHNLLRTVYKLWQTDESFRKLYGEQTHLCLPHYRMVVEGAAKGHMSKKDFTSFYEESRRLCLQYLRELEVDVTHFCRMFDYRSKGQSWGNSKDAIERAVKFLTSREANAVHKADEKNY